MFENVPTAKPDAILGLTDAFKKDPNPNKINLAVGVYKDAQGQTPTLAAVKEAERWLLDNEPTKSYLPIPGSPGYDRLTRAMLFGQGSPLVDDGRAVTFQCPGGTGALRVAADYLQQNHEGTTLWMSTPTWPNHPAIFAAANLPTRTYPYFNIKTNTLDIEGMIGTLDRIEPGDVVLLHGCCHNPTGIDPTPEQWREIAEHLAAKGALPLMDFAYQGFADGLDEDAAGLRAILAACGEVLIASSYSKNFGLYRERVGALTLVATSADHASAVDSQLKLIVRRNYSNPPAHGGLVVERILSDAALTKQWRDELDAMRGRINRMRQLLAEQLDQRGVKLSPDGNNFIQQQRGMFTMSGLTQDHVAKLRENHAIYIVGSGRINVAGLTESNIPTLCDAIAGVR